MATFAGKHNPGITKLFLFNIPDNFTFTDLKGLAEKYGMANPFKVNAIHINSKGRYGEQPVIVTDNELVNAPHHLMNCVHEILKDGESVSMINSGHVGFKVYSYENAHGPNYSLEWVDL